MAFPSGLFQWCVARSGWEASLLSTWGCLAPAPSWWALLCQMEEPPVPLFPPRKVCGQPSHLSVFDEPGDELL